MTGKINNLKVGFDELVNDTNRAGIAKGRKIFLLN
jgi:hypothetical protein